jgi:transcriptional regulator with XRE-family HTH domain
MEIAERLKLVMNYYELTPSSFADRLDVQRSSISHLLSGRNNPSLDFVMKVLATFPEVDLFWLVNGVGEFPINENKSSSFSNTQFSANQKSIQQTLCFEADVKDELPEINPINAIAHQTAVEKEIEQIVIFYKDGFFKNYSPKN